MGLRAYARRRGTSAPSVLRAIARGRLKDSLVYVEGVAQIADPDLADREWQRNTDYSKAPGSVKEQAAAVEQGVAPGVTPLVTPGAPAPILPEVAGSLADASRNEKVWKARMAELEYREAAGELVDKKELTARWADICTRIRTKLLGVPGKVKSRFPALTLEEVAAMTAGIREALEELADGSILHQ